MVSFRKVTFTFLGLFLCASALSSCSTPVATQDRIKSVSWVNAQPVSFQHIETMFCESKTPAILEELPAYSEQAVSVDYLRYEDCNVKTKAVIAGNQISMGSGYIPPPIRTSSQGEYNLRIQFRNGSEGPTTKLTLEPLSLMQARLQPSTGN
ncbi:hypothetical protein P3T73_12965 [Kiritimatiellota bacterium B12222]|nr:hypothetical protein P3T73_12965 [Kiritimatiellota bacterium B12222]